MILTNWEEISFSQAVADWIGEVYSKLPPIPPDYHWVIDEDSIFKESISDNKYKVTFRLEKI